MDAAAADHNVEPMRISWIGHATVLLEMDGVRLLTDPVLRRWVGPLRRRQPGELPDLTRLDAILLSHAHMDHLDWRSLGMLDRTTPLVAPAGLVPRRRGRPNVFEMEPGDARPFGSVKVTATRAEHDDRRFPLGARRTPLGYRIDGSRSVYFAGDTDLFDGMAEIGNGGLDLALLPISGWGSRLPAGHLSPLSAAQALQLLRPRIAVPIHWGTFAPLTAGRGAQGHSDLPSREFARHAADIAPDVRIVVLQPGAAVEL
jgi:L-ascorbate metabolism protein UlaG (beta-lactamase superfamily)